MDNNFGFIDKNTQISNVNYNERDRMRVDDTQK